MAVHPGPCAWKASTIWSSVPGPTSEALVVVGRDRGPRRQRRGRRFRGARQFGRGGERADRTGHFGARRDHAIDAGTAEGRDRDGDDEDCTAYHCEASLSMMDCLLRRVAA